MSGARPDTWMPLYIGDLLRDIPHLDAEKAGAYLLLIMAYWVSGRPLPDDDEHLSTVARVGLTRWRKVLRRILSPFFQVVDGEWRHKRIDKELGRAARISNERSKSGAKGAANRWQLDSNAIAEPLANASQNDAQSQSQSPIELIPPKIESVGTPPIGVADYSFSGDVIRLSRADFEKLQRDFKHLNGALRGEIAKADAYYRDNPPKAGKWWFPLNRWLAKADKDAAAEKQAGPEESW